MAGRVYIGIDPGLDGAIAVLDGDGCVCRIYDTPTIRNGKRRSIFVSEFARIFRELCSEYRMELITVGIEKVGAMPGNSGASMFNFGRTAGVIEGMLSGIGLSYTLVHPRRWQKRMLADVEGKDTKARSVLAASRLFPSLQLTRKKDHNRADAALIAAYVRATEEGGV